jgi:sporulation protein YlmC with PRC-barrel domain
MRLSDLLGRTVVDAGGHDLGHVRDVRLRARGPVDGAALAALDVEAVVVGGAGTAVRLGYVRGGVRGPWLLKALAGWQERKALEIPWADLEVPERPEPLRARRPHPQLSRVGQG